MQNDRTTILVTGGAGFIGTNLVRRLLAGDGRTVVNLDKLTYAANPLSLADLQGHDRYAFVHGDIADRALVGEVLTQYRPAAILHLAAETHVDRSIGNPEAFVQANVVGTARLLEETLRFWQGLPAGAQQAFRFVQVSTDEVFGTLDADGFFTEDSAYAPNSPYAASKAAGDHFARAFHQTYGLPVILTHCSNNYGPCQSPEKLVPMVILRALRGEPIPIYGDGSNERDWIYVDDHCRALEMLLEKGRSGGSYAIGAGHPERNLDLVRQICSTLEALVPPPPAGSASYAELIRFVGDRPGHDRRYAIDAGRLRNELGWSPQESLQSGLAKTVRWYLDHPDWISAADDGRFRDWVRENYAWRWE